MLVPDTDRIEALSARSAKVGTGFASDRALIY
jgi:hypothetical protein